MNHVSAADTGVHFESLQRVYRGSKMEDGENKVELEMDKDRKSYAGIPEADFVVSAAN